MKPPTIKIIKKLLFGIFLGLIFFTCHSTTKAAVQVVQGHVWSDQTRTAGIDGIWIQWRDKNGKIRYEQTRNGGSFLFSSWQALSQTDRDGIYNTMIDPDLTGGNDMRKANTTTGYAFGCWENPQTLNVVRPADTVKWGTFAFDTRCFPGDNNSCNAFGGNEKNVTYTLAGCGTCRRTEDCSCGEDGCCPIITFTGPYYNASWPTVNADGSMTFDVSNTSAAQTFDFLYVPPAPTPTPTPTITPTPTPTPKVCPIPDKPLNVRIECPYCQQ